MDGHYFWDLFPAFLISGIGMAFAFIPMTIGGLAGVDHSEAGIASGLINTSQQIGGAIGVAAATTIAATYTSHYLAAHPGVAPTSGAALTHGFGIAFYVLAAVAAVAAIARAARRVEGRARGAGLRPRGRGLAGGGLTGAVTVGSIGLTTAATTASITNDKREVPMLKNVVAVAALAVTALAMQSVAPPPGKPPREPTVATVTTPDLRAVVSATKSVGAARRRLPR